MVGEYQEEPILYFIHAVRQRFYMALNTYIHMYDVSKESMYIVYTYLIMYFFINDYGA